MKRYLSLVVALVLALPTLAFAASYNIDPDHSNIGFKVRHLMVSNVKGVFGKVQGAVFIDEKDLTRSNVNVTIDASSVDTGVVKRDTHLRSPDFLDVAKYPTITFASRKVVRVGKERLNVLGDLTIHGVTKPVVLDVEGVSGESKDPWGNLRRGATASTKISRKDFGLVWNKSLETGGVVVGDEVFITLEVEMIKQVPK
ncbi:YceI family protein [Geomesophilobacter sediminis]|uniref:Polyisoprenoid-binding protein n=1 Tax=Geomesophilobacter sediminis TaxID=2798584 RepID=A0A8J7JG55_9BACT|nr:YceI family protein [Geomesophilobacter sediminis]MBJ6723405.1 polyisoprenoid-binding protein [Geomesophilobacter sediminis]